MLDLIIGVIVGAVLSFIITFSVAHYYDKKQSEKFEKAMEKIAEMGKEKEVITQQPLTQDKTPHEPEPQSKPKPPPMAIIHDYKRDETEGLQPLQKQYSYDLSRGTTTTDPVIKELFDYGKRKLGKKVIDGLLDSIFEGEEEIYECPECGAEVEYDDIECPECGEELEEE